MTDFEDAIRDRMNESALTIPVDGFALNRTGAELTVRHLRPLLYEMLGRTKRADREHGVAAWHFPAPESPSVDDLKTSEVEEGLETSVSSVSPPSSAPVAFDLHTHPIPGTLGFSQADTRSIAGSLLQYPARVEGPALSRHFGVVTQRFGDEKRDTAAAKVVTADPSVTQLSIEEQKQISQDMIQTSRENEFKQLSDRLGTAEEYLTVTYEKFQLPEPASTLSFRSAVPDEVDDRKFGNAFAQGDLRGILTGAEWV